MRSERLTIECISDQGTYRSRNEDAFYVLQFRLGKQKGVFAVVCDGVGGAYRGDLASSAAVEGLKEWFMHNVQSFRKSTESDWVINLLKQRIVFISEKLFEYGKLIGRQTATTLTVLLVTGATEIVIQVGDTAIYSGTVHLRKLTENHTLTVQGKSGNVIYSALGDCRIRRFHISSKVAEDRYILCTDGFYKRLTDTELLAVLSGNLGTTEAVNRLRTRNERDNATAILIRNCNWAGKQHFLGSRRMECWDEREFIPAAGSWKVIKNGKQYSDSD